MEKKRTRNKSIHPFHNILENATVSHMYNADRKESYFKTFALHIMAADSLFMSRRVAPWVCTIAAKTRQVVLASLLNQCQSSISSCRIVRVSHSAQHGARPPPASVALSTSSDQSGPPVRPGPGPSLSHWQKEPCQELKQYLTSS